MRDVVSLTGINPVTLRAWERRHGLIRPQRTEGGHRLYTARDVQRIRDILRWTANGLPISKVGDRLTGRPEAPVQQASAFAYESRELLALTAYVARQSRGMPIDITADARTRPFLDGGRAAFYRRQGQLNLACSQCHDDQWGKKLAGNVIPQAHPTGYPVYRLEWQSLGSLQRRLRNCLVGIRAEPYEYGAPELIDLELFLMWRARGMAIETPAVRP